MITLDRLALNQVTIKYATLTDAIAAAAAAGIAHLGVWRESIAEMGAVRAGRLIRDAGLQVSTLCRGGFFTDSDAEGRLRALASNRTAIVEAQALSTRELVLVAGGLAPEDRDLPSARDRVAEAIGELVPFAVDHGVRLAIEPLHPMLCADRCVISTLSQALDIAEQFPATAVGVVIDTYHLWWDPALRAQIARAKGRIASFQLGDWVLPLPANVALGRGHLGDGCIDFRSIADVVDAAGYTGPVEVEIFNEAVWDTPTAQTVATVRDRFRRHFG